MNFFISRAGEDRDIAQEIAAILQSAGHTTTLQDDDFLPGQSFPHQMRLAMERADHIIAVISPHYINKEFPLNELYSAFVEDPLGKKRRLIPVRVAACDLPHPIKSFIYLDFVNQDAPHRKQALLAAIAPPRDPRPEEIRTFVRKLPTADPHLFGRDAQLAWLEQAWLDPRANFVQIIAPGGAGKTALMTRWYRRHIPDATVFGWSFYSQGTGEKSQTSSDPFFAEVLNWFGIPVPATANIFTKVDLLVPRLRQERVLLILDGIEPLQDPDGSLRDLALKALLQELAAHNAGLVLATTRVRLTDVPDALPDEAPHSLSLDLENLDPADGARYLAHLGVRGPEDELRAASESYENHALALTLLGTYLVKFCRADIRRRLDIRKLLVDKTKPGQHARRVMASYARMYRRQPELKILRALGYFNRPAEPEALKLVLPPMDELTYQAALNSLHDARLILTTDPAQPLDCHPLVREHFAAYATPESHARLYEHYANQAPPYPDTLEQMTLLFYAVQHGCRAGLHEALIDIFIKRILRGDEAYLVKKLGVPGTALSVLANFFAAPWTEPVASLSPQQRSSVNSYAGFALRALGRLTDAIAPMQAGAEGAKKLEDWWHAARYYSNLSLLHLALGDLKTAIGAGRQALECADLSRDSEQRMKRRASLAHVLHQSGQSGELTEAMEMFMDAEQLHPENSTARPILFALAGYRYCDLLLSQNQTEEVLRRASQTIVWDEGSLLDNGLDHLLLGRVHAPVPSEAPPHLDQAVDFLRRAGRLDFLPLALLARGTPDDLDEVFRIATRSGMRLHLADYHLASARLALRNGDRPKALDHFTKAETLIQETGYHRRDPELVELRLVITPKQPK